MVSFLNRENACPDSPGPKRRDVLNNGTKPKCGRADCRTQSGADCWRLAMRRRHDGGTVDRLATSAGGAIPRLAQIAHHSAGEIP
jgi:hypothetical protein